MLCCGGLVWQDEIEAIVELWETLCDTLYLHDFLRVWIAFVSARRFAVHKPWRPRVNGLDERQYWQAVAKPWRLTCTA